MNEKIDFEDIRNIFIEIERKYAVYELECNNVYYWKLIRFSLWEEIINKMGFSGDSHANPKIKKLRFLIYYSAKNMLRKKRISKNEVLVLTDGRKYKINNNLEDIYLFDILRELDANNTKHLIIDAPDDSGNHLGKDRRNLVYFESFGNVFEYMIRNKLYPFFRKKIDISQTVEIINSIEEEIQKKFCVEIDLENLIKKRILRFILEKKRFSKLLTKVKPKVFYLVQSYGKEHLIEAAREYGIKVIEMQHGIINRYHLGYYFPFDFPIPYFPDQIILFGQYWKDSLDFPVNNMQTTRSFSFYKNQMTMDIKNLKKEAVVFISPGYTESKFSKLAADFSRNYDIQCYYKLHPSEYVGWKKGYPQLYECAKRGNIEIIADEMSIYELFSRCNYSIGINSTSIYESLMFECKTYVVCIQGYQYMKHLIESNYVKLISCEFSLDDLKSFNNKMPNKSYFYL